MVKKIALEEHFLCPDFIEYWNPTVVDLPAERRDKALTRLTDFGDLRLAAMDETGICRAVIGLAGPGVQAERDTALAIRRARAQPTIFWRAKLSTNPIAIPDLPTWPCRMRTPPPPSSNAAYASSNSPVR